MSPSGDIAPSPDGTGHAWRQRQRRQQYRLPGMVQVRLATPDIAAGLVVWTEFVVPTAVNTVDELGFAKLPETPVPGFVVQLASAFEQGLGCGAGFGVGPVQAFTHHRALVPVEGVDNARGAIHGPGIFAGAGEQALGVDHQPLVPGATPAAPTQNRGRG